jgi:hypothetical protein
MSSTSPRRKVTRLALLACSAVTGVAAGQAVTGVASAAPGIAPASQLVTLITGDQVQVGGSGTVSVVRPAAPNSVFRTFRGPTGDAYVVPAAAAPYLGRGLDQSLFDVSALVRDGFVGNKAVPVTTVGSSAAPGITAGPSAGTGSYDAASARVFGAALRRQIGADVAAGRVAGSTPVAGLKGLRLGAGAEPPVASPRYPLRTLQVDAVENNGAPADGYVQLFNTDSLRRLNTVVPVVDGIGKVNVPAGNYAAFTSFYDFDQDGNLTAAREVLVNDFTVPDTGSAAVTLDARSATSEITVSTPRPATQDGLLTTLVRGDATGALTFGGDAFSANFTAPVPMYVSPQPAAKVGTSHYVVQWDATAPGGSGAYRYDVAFASDNGIPADQHHVVRPNQLATVRQHVYADPAGAGSGYFIDVAYDPLLAAVNAYFPVAGRQPVPSTFTHYVGTADTGAWLQGAVAPSFLELDSSQRIFRARHHYDIEWLHGPIAPKFGQYHGPGLACLACTSGSNMVVLYSMVGDSEPDHYQSFFGPENLALHFTLDRDGTTIADATDAPGALVSDIPLTPSTYRAVLDIDMTRSPGVSLGTRTHTETTFHYHPAVDPSQTLPSGDVCQTPSTGDPCQILPTLGLTYHLASDIHNTSTAAVQTMALTVAHQSYDGHGSRSPIRSASVSVSFDGGASWHPAAIRGTGGHYLATWRNHGAAGTKPYLRVTAADAEGNTVTQTVDNAYLIGGTR